MYGKSNSNAGKLELGINGFDKHRPVYFVAVAPVNGDDQLVITDPYPEQYYIIPMEVGTFTYHDWSDQYAEGYFYQHMQIDGGILKYTAYDQDGNVRDVFTLTKK